MTLLVARVVGSSGEVAGKELDAISIAWAKVRVPNAGLRNVRFTQADETKSPVTNLSTQQSAASFRCSFPIPFLSCSSYLG